MQALGRQILIEFYDCKVRCLLTGIEFVNTCLKQRSTLERR